MEPGGFAVERGGSIGGYLGSQRRLRDISIDELAERTKIPVRSLERLESGAFDATPDGFTRGFVRSVAEALGLDPEEAVMRLLREPQAEESGWLADRGRRRSRPSPPWVFRAALGAAAALVVLGLFTLFAALRSDPVEPQPAPTRVDPSAVQRHDPVRALAETVADVDAAPGVEPDALPAAAPGVEPDSRSEAGGGPDSG